MAVRLDPFCALGRRYDYVDAELLVLRRIRQKTYHALGYTLTDPR